MHKYKEIAAEIRKKIVRMHTKSGSSHIGSALSAVDILTVLYFNILRIDQILFFDVLAGPHA